MVLRSLLCKSEPHIRAPCGLLKSSFEQAIPETKDARGATQREGNKDLNPWCSALYSENHNYPTGK